MLKRVDPKHLTVEDFAQLYTADQAGPAFNSIAPPDAVARLWDGSLLLYRAGDKGIFLLEINEGGDGTKRLNIVRAAGEGLVLHSKEIASDLQHIARENNCNAIETIVYSPKLARALTRGGAKQESVTMVLELNDGQE